MFLFFVVFDRTQYQSFILSLKMVGNVQFAVLFLLGGGEGGKGVLHSIHTGD